MRILRLLTLPLALGLGALLALPEESAGFDTLGHKLGLDVRHVRVFNNFTDPSANDNTSSDPSFPGYDGAELAIWKAAAEWGSELRAGTGAGDPTQTLGSGGANFDASWQGNATTAGGSNSNIHSELDGSAGGILAFAVSSNAGWRIRYYRDWTWSDGPGSPPGGQFDLQGVATHEYGHALGLDHSTSSIATMRASIIGNGTPTRSIEADDVAGIQSIYGAKLPGKPSITGVVVAGQTVTITGERFSPSGNQVWFTKAGVLGNGEPIVVDGVDSTAGGTEIEVQLPPGSGPGELLVRKDGTGHAALSNAWPYDATGPPPPELEEPLLTGISPEVVPSVVVGNEQTVLLTGENLLSVTEVRVDGKGLPLLPVSFSVVDENTITLAMPVVDSLGDVDVEVLAVSGSSVAPVNVVPADPPALELGVGYPVEILLSLTGIDLTLGGEPGLLFLPMVSPELVPTVIPGLLDLAIGNGFTSLVIFGAYTIEPQGWVKVHIPLGKVPSGLPLYFQGVQYDPLVGTLSIVESNVAEGLLLF